MADALIIHKNRTNIIQVHLGIDVSGDIITSEIREHKEVDSTLIVAWDVSFLTDGVDGKLVCTIDDSLLDDITQDQGFMDMKRVSNGEPLATWNFPVRVRFKEVVTA